MVDPASRVATYTVASASPYDGRNTLSLKVEAGEPLGEALQRRGLYPFATAEDAWHVAEVKPGHVVI